MILVSANDIAIRLADKDGTLKVTEGLSRFGDKYWAVSDDYGTIEVFSSKLEMARVLTRATEKGETK